MNLTLAILIALGALGCEGAHAQNAVGGTGQPPAKTAAVAARVWGALVFATNEADAPAGKRPPPQYADLSQRLAKVFPFQRFAILGEHEQGIFREHESWVMPTDELFMRVDSRGEAPGGGVKLHVQVWREKQVLVKTDTVLRAGSPLFIGGPKWRNGQLIFVLVLQR